MTATPTALAPSTRASSCARAADGSVAAELVDEFVLVEFVVSRGHGH